MWGWAVWMGERALWVSQRWQKGHCPGNFPVALQLSPTTAPRGPPANDANHTDLTMHPQRRVDIPFIGIKIQNPLATHNLLLFCGVAHLKYDIQGHGVVEVGNLSSKMPSTGLLRIVVGRRAHHDLLRHTQRSQRRCGGGCGCCCCWLYLRGLSRAGRQRCTDLCLSASQNLPNDRW